MLFNPFVVTGVGLVNKSVFLLLLHQSDLTSVPLCWDLMWNGHQMSSRIAASEFRPLSDKTFESDVPFDFTVEAWLSPSILSITKLETSVASLLLLLPFSFLPCVATKSWRLHLPFLFINPGLSLTQFRPPYLSQALPDWLVGTDVHLLFRGTQGGWGEHIWLCNSPNKILSHTLLHTIMSKPLYGGEKSPPSCTFHPLLTPSSTPRAIFHPSRLV